MGKKFFIVLMLLAAACVAAVHGEPTALLRNPFFAMDTSYRRSGQSHEQQLDLVRQLGFAGVSENVEPAEAMKKTAADIQSRGLKLFAIYTPAQATPQGDLVAAADLPAVMEALKGSGTIVWLHIGGQGPAFSTLTAETPVCKKLRELAETAKTNGLKIAVYPHLGEWTARFADAVTLAKVVDHESFGVCFNLCHCLAGGDEKDIPSLLDSAGSRLFVATINGADSGVHGANWGKLIQPLGRGSFDVKIVLDGLKRNHFAGPVGFQGYGIPGDARPILEPTIKAWNQLSVLPAASPALPEHR